MTDTPGFHHPSWNPSLERVIKKEGEQAQSLYWLHNRSETLSARKNDYLAIPMIVLSTLTGFLTGGASDAIPSWALGGLSVLCGILGTINTYFRFAQSSEGHRVAATLYLKLFKQIEVELALPPDQRTDPGTLLKNIRDQMSRVSETAPRLDQKSIDEHRTKFHDEPVSKPLVANGLEQIHIYNATPPVRQILQPRVDVDA